MATHSSILAWEILGTAGPGGLLSTGSQTDRTERLHFTLVGLVTKSCPTLATPWTVARQAPLSMRFSRQEYWSGLPFSCPGDLPDPGIKPGFPALQADSFPTEL